MPSMSERRMSMTLNERNLSILEGIKSPSALQLKEALEALEISLEDLKPFLQSPEGKPYYRRLLYKNEETELLVMNWSDIECAPHDHGSSLGWIRVMDGGALNTVYEMKDALLPRELFTRTYQKGSFFFAPKRGIHKMQRGDVENLVTLHLYAPPIEGMKVFDLEKCAACVVSNECGAWWPDNQKQKLKDIRVSKY
jgi:cysteine dioxygenase